MLSTMLVTGLVLGGMLFILPQNAHADHSCQPWYSYRPVAPRVNVVYSDRNSDFGYWTGGYYRPCPEYVYVPEPRYVYVTEQPAYYYYDDGYCR